MPGWLYVVRAAGNIVNLSTPLGVVTAHLGGCRVGRGERGMLFATGYRLKFPNASAFCVGNVVISRESLSADDPAEADVLAHEEAHSWQWLAFGPLFLPAYGLAMGWSWLRTGDRGAAHVFEHWAGLERGGYRRLPKRPLRLGVLAAGRLVSGRLSRLRKRSS